MKALLLNILLLCIPLGLLAQTETVFEKRLFIQEGDTLNYRILFPANMEEKASYPVVLFLHGAGERGDDNEAQLTHASKLFLENREEFPAIVIFPQVPKDDYWVKMEVNREVSPMEWNFLNSGEPTRSMRMLINLMDSLTGKKYVDNDRIYVGGLSMGGMGTYDLLSRRPEMFAAAFAICGGADPAIVEEYPKWFNIWIFHGEKDDIVPPGFSKTMARAINAAGGNAKLSLYPEANHNSWDAAFAEPYFLPWLFKHKKN